MAANPFSVNFLGGFDLGGAVDDVAAAYEKRKEKQDLESKREELKRLMQGAAGGDAESIEGLMALNPNLGLQFEQREMQRKKALGEQKAKEAKEVELDWLLRYKQASTPEQKDALKQEALQNPLIDFDESDLSVGDNQSNLAINAALYSHLGKDGYKALLSDSGGAGSIDPTANIQDYEYYQRLKKTDPEMAKEFGQRVGFVSKEGRELSPYYQKQLTTYTDLATESELNAEKYSVMANDFEKLDPTAGMAGSAFEFLKQATGQEDAVSELRKEYLKLRASQTVKNLPPGAASDKDIELALSGFPKPTANPDHMASFLRGLEKMQRLEAEYNKFKAQYLSERGTERGMLEAWKSQQPKESNQEKVIDWNEL